MNGPAHFIYFQGGGEWTPQHDRAVFTAHVHADDVMIHHIQPPAWLANHPIKLANVKDYYAYGILYEYGGIYLDFDTISLRPAWDLLGGADVCPATAFPPDDETHPHHNTFVLLGSRFAPILRELELEALRLLTDGVAEWGALGPSLISRFVQSSPEHFSPAPYNALSGWSYHTIDSYYEDPRDPGPDCRVIHGYSSDHPAWWEDTWMPPT
jgi:hypothetical protein